MAVQEHAYYGSFGYQVTSFFAPSSRFGTPAELHALVDAAHGYGLQVLFELVHAHASSNTADGLNELDGSSGGYFLEGKDGWHPEWHTRMFDFGKLETIRFLLAQVCYFAEAYRIDGFRFDAVSAALYRHRSMGGRGRFERGDEDYYGEGCMLDVDALTYFKLVNLLTHELVRPPLITIAEEHSCLPGLCAPVPSGGVGFDFRQAMGVPNAWQAFIGTASGLKRTASPRTILASGLRPEPSTRRSVSALVGELCLRRAEERRLAYVECHDQSIVGGQSFAFRLMGAHMFDGMSTLHPPIDVIARGMALHKLSRLLTYALAGEAYLTFVGNEFGHPEWVDLPREGNGNSYAMARRLWPLADDPELRYSQLQAFDEAMHQAHSSAPWLHEMAPSGVGKGCACTCCDVCELVWFRRGSCFFAFNFGSHETATVGFQLPVDTTGPNEPRLPILLLDSNEKRFGGDGRVAHACVVDGRRAAACRVDRRARHDFLDSGTSGDGRWHAALEVRVRPLSACVSTLRMRGSGPPPTPSAVTAGVEPLLAWAYSNGAYVSRGIRVGEVSGKGLGIVATRRLRKGSLLVRIPMHMMLTADTDEQLAFQLLAEARRPAQTPSFWSPYLSLLPPTGALDHPLFMNATGEAALQGTEVQKRLRSRRARVESIHRSLATTMAVDAAGRQSSDVVSPARWPLDNVAWAMATTWARAPAVTRAHDGAPAPPSTMIPVGDLFNHAHGARVNVHSTRREARSIVDFTATRDVNAGEELLVSYGHGREPPNSELFTQFGFCVPFNVHDEVRLAFLSAEPLAPAGTDSDPRDHTADDARRRRLVEALDLAAYAHSATLTLQGEAAQPPPELVAMARVLGLSGDALAVATRASILGEQPATLEQRGFAELAARVQARLLLYPVRPSVQEDEREIAHSGWRVTSGEGCALHIRAAERRILHHWNLVLSQLATGGPRQARTADMGRERGADEMSVDPLSSTAAYGPVLHTFIADASFAEQVLPMTGTRAAHDEGSPTTLEVREVRPRPSPHGTAERVPLRGVVMARGRRLGPGDLAGCYTGRAISMHEKTIKLSTGFEAYSFPVNATHVMDPTDGDGYVAPDTRHEMALVNEPNGEHLPNLWPMDYGFGNCRDRHGEPGVAYVAVREILEGEELTVCYGSTYAYRSGYETVCADNALMERWTAVQQRVVGRGHLRM